MQVFASKAFASQLSLIVLSASLIVIPAQSQTRLIMTSLSPANSPNSNHYNEWAERVNKASGGALQIIVHDESALANFSNVYDRTISDAVQIG